LIKSNRNIETELIEKAAEGDAAAFGKIYFLLRDPIYGFAFRMLGENSTAEDITQETFVFFIENSKKYQAERGSLLSFLCGVARNRILHHLRKNGDRFDQSQDEIDNFIEPADEFGRSPLEVLLEQELEIKVNESLAELPPLQREAIILREMQELSYEDIARITGDDVNAVKVRIYRARRNLARRIAPYLKAEKSEKENCYEMHRS
jgi:RNA polymerase sigma-70 factor (ECF subfamily)